MKEQVNEMMQLKIIVFIVRLGDRVEAKTQRVINKSTDHEKDRIMGSVHTPQGIQYTCQNVSRQIVLGLRCYFVQYDVSVTQDGELPLDRTLKQKNKICNTKRQNEFRKRMLYFHVIICVEDSCNMNLVDLQFSSSSYVVSKFVSSL
jgi:hypothetical protein